MPGPEKKSIEALKIIRSRMGERWNIAELGRTWAREISIPPMGGKSSENWGPLAEAAELHYQPVHTPEHNTCINWWRGWCSRQELPNVGHEGREIGSRIYGGLTTMAAVMALNAPGVPQDLDASLRQWFRRHFLMQALGAVPQTQGQAWYKGPTVTSCGMRSVSKDGMAEIRGVNNDLDTLFALATGMHFSNRRFKAGSVPYICEGLDMGLTQEEQEALQSLVDGAMTGPHALAIFRDDLPGLVARVPMLIKRWVDGSAGTLVMRDIGVSTPPVYGMIMRGRQAKPASYLVTHTPPMKRRDYERSGKPGNAGERDGVWWANAEQHVEIPLPTAPLLYSVLIDDTGVHVDGEASQPGSPPVPPIPPVKPPAPPKPPDLPPEPQTPEWHLTAALRALDGGNERRAVRHAQIAIRFMSTKKRRANESR